MAGREYADVRANTVPAFALGDYEWILAFEGPDLGRIVELMWKLRYPGPAGTHARRHRFHRPAPRRRGTRQRAALSPRSGAVRVLGTSASGDRVDAVPLIGGRRIALAGEHVAEVTVAVGAQHLHPAHAQRIVWQQDHRIGLDGVEERRPAAVRLEFLCAAEQFGAAGAAVVHALGMVSVYSPIPGRSVPACRRTANSGVSFEPTGRRSVPVWAGS